MGTIDLNRLPRASTPAYRSALEKLVVGSTLSLHVGTGHCDLVSNGIVTAVEGDSIWADMPRLSTTHLDLWRPPSPAITLNAGTPVRKGTLKRDAHCHLFETYPDGRSCQVSGMITALIADAFKVGDQWFDYGGKQDGKRRRLTIMGGR